MARPLQVFTVFSALLVCAPLVAPAGAVAVPDSAQRAELQERVGRLDRVQIVGPGGATLLLKPVVREDGIRMCEPWQPPRPALIVLGDVPAPPRPTEFVPWSAIERVQVHHQDALTGMGAGAAFGALLVGATLLVNARVVARSWERGSTWIMAGSAVVIGGTSLAGLLIGASSQGWRTVYPPLEPVAKPRR